MRGKNTNKYEYVATSTEFTGLILINYNINFPEYLELMYF